MNGMLLLVVLLSAAGQVLVKAGAERTLPGEDEPGRSGSPVLKRFAAFLGRAMNLRLVCGAACVALVPLIYTRALSSLPLSRAYGATGLTYPLLSAQALFSWGKGWEFVTLWEVFLLWGGFLLWSGIPWIR